LGELGPEPGQADQVVTLGLVHAMILSSECNGGWAVV
jgi:hypothetical protein